MKFRDYLDKCNLATEPRHYQGNQSTPGDERGPPLGACRASRGQLVLSPMRAAPVHPEHSTSIVRPKLPRFVTSGDGRSTYPAEHRFVQPGEQSNETQNFPSVPAHDDPGTRSTRSEEHT